jgi:hypothetical protein
MALLILAYLALALLERLARERGYQVWPGRRGGQTRG